MRAELARLLGGERGHLERNLNVSGSVDVIGGVLAISGNAPHRGTEEEAVVCVKDWITLAKAGHVDRLKQPGNVRLARPPPAGDPAR